MADIKYVNLEKIVENINKVYAHSRYDGNKPVYETLIEHSETVLKNLKMLIEKKNLNNIINNIAGIFFESEENIVLWKNLFFNAVYLHDLGKINVNFQTDKMNNLEYKSCKEITTSNHSMFSAYLYIEVMLEHFFPEYEIEDIDEGMLYFLVLNAYIISKHHGSLDSFVGFVDEKLGGDINGRKISKLLFNYRGKIQIEDIQYDLEIDDLGSFEHYIYTKLLFSILIVSDIYGTREYVNDEEVEDIGVFGEGDDLFQNIFKPDKGSVFYNIEKYRKFLENESSNPFEEGSINVLRTEMFLEAERNLLEGIESNIFYLEAPTGAGKTITSLNLAYRMIEKKSELNKIFYIFPFNTLVEQTKISLEDILGKEVLEGRMGVINSLTPIEVDDSGEMPDYDKALMEREFLHYPLVLTSHVNFFKYLFGVSKSDNFPLLHLANSVIIMDEIQSYKNSIWREIIQFLYKYGELLNIKIIIMSATLPNLSYLAGNDNYIRLIENRDKYFQATIFKERVKIDYSLLNIDKDDILSCLIDKIRGYPKQMILVEFLSKKEAFKFYTLLNEFEINSELLTGDDSKGERRRIIDKVREQEKVGKDGRKEGMVLVSTQVIEAGVDIDMDIGFKDISLFDSEEQFMGRINRSCKKTGKVYFFNLTDAQTIYKSDERRNASMTLSSEENRELLKNKDFDGYYKKIMKRLEIRNEFLEEPLKMLDFKGISKEMKLIDKQQKYQVFMNRSLEINEKGRIKKLVGQEVWNEFYEVLKIDKKRYSERKVKLSKVMEKMNEFIYELYELPSVYSDEKAGILFIENGEDYFTAGKLDRDKLGMSKEFDFFT